MSKKSLIIVLFIIWACIQGVHSQNNTNSPYTRYGYGTLVDAGFGQNASMGGISYGLRSNRFTNPGNPASYTAIDTLTFRFEAAAGLRFSSFEDAGGKQTRTNGNLEYIGLHFPIKRWLGFSAGLLPYSVVGYDFSSTETQPSSITSGSLVTNYLYKGIGGITQLYLGTAVIPYKNLSLGLNLNIDFGTMQHASLVSFNESAYFPTSQVKTIRVFDVNALFGAQYTLLLPKERKVTFGAIFQPKSNLGGEAEKTIITTDTVTITDNNGFDMPLTFGLGAVYNVSGKLSAGLDYKYQAWSNAKYFGETPFNDRHKFSVGVEYQPNNSSKNYFNRIYYRAGANYSNFYAKVNDNDLSEYALTAGLGLPIKRGLNPTVLNIVFEYGNKGTTAHDLIKEQYYKFTLNMTINEHWFIKRKFD